MTALWQRYFHGSFSAARAYLLLKLFLCMVALDTFLLMIGHAGRYGVDGFNVAHFRWLDRLEPLPTATLYVGVLVLTGLLALSIALCGMHPLALFALFLLYTFSWSMSMLDSYQHHYFVSSILLCLVFFPRVTALDVHPLPAASAANAGKANRKHEQAKQAAARAQSQGWLYVLACGVAISAYAFIDAKQHSWLLFEGCIGVVALSTWLYAGTTSGTPKQVSGFGYNLLGATVGVLYVYTSVAKMDAQWCAGHTIRKISAAETVFAPLVGWFVQLGVPAERFWSLFATSVIPLELAVAAGYLLAVCQDASDKRWVRWASALAWFMAMTLHVGAEAMGLEIGWFSYYMMLLACAFLLPAPVVDKLATLLTWPARFASLQLTEWESSEPSTATTLSALGLAAAMSVVLGLVGHQLDLPGAQTACLLAAAALIALTLWAVWRQQTAGVRKVILGAGIAALLMWAAIARSEVRWDFYRYLGGDLRRRQKPEAALEAYLKGERYAPAGQSRADKIRELKAQLGR